jgi:hypothetical protein
MCGIDWVNVGKVGVYYIQNGIKWWKNGVESSPLNSTTYDVTDGIDNIAEINFPFSFPVQKNFDTFPLGVRAWLVLFNHLSSIFFKIYFLAMLLLK